MSAGRQYKLIRELGTGTFGTVYQAEMTSAAGFKKHVALKVLHPMWETDKDAARRFRDEARLLGQLHHRHIVQVDGLVKVGGRWAVVMEFVAGCDGNVVLKACRKSATPFPVPAALEVISAVASALDAAYNAKPEGGESLRVIHRDIKPSNIRLTEDGDVKVLDFGIARADFQGREAVTHSVRYGSVRYMAPERHHAAPDTPAGDVFALGCVLFELLTGKPLGNVEAEWAQHHEKVHAKVARLREGLGDQGQGIVELITEMLAFEPEERPSAGELADRARSLARSYPGEDLASFSRRFMSQVPRFVPDTSMPIERVVSEGAGSSEEIAQNRAALPPVLHEHGDELPKAQGRRIALIGMVLGATLIAAVLIALRAFVGAEASSTSDSAAVTQLATVGASAASMTAGSESDGTTPSAAAPDPIEPGSEGAAGAAEGAPHTAEPSSAEPVPSAAPVATPASAGNAAAVGRVATPERATGRSQVPTRAAPAPKGPPIRAAKFTLVDATAISAECVGSAANGTTSALVRELQRGPCTIRATVAGTAYEAVVDVTSEQGLLCDIKEGVLSCR